MNKLITILIGVSLAITATLAQQDEGTPAGKKRKQQRQQRQEERQQQRNPRQQQRQMQRPNQSNARQGGQSDQATRREMRNRPESTNAAPNQRENANENRSTTRSRRENAAANENQSTTRNQRRNAGADASQSTTRNRRQNAGVNDSQTGNQNARRNAKAKPDSQTVQRIRQQHANFHAKPRPEKVPSVTYQENYRISNAEHWQGPQYAAFRSYRPVRHDRGWWNSHYNHIVLIGGGYYFWDNGYWYPAWGYDPAASYYAYNGPIYTGRVVATPDQVIANVQAVLQDMGYYKGEVDGLLGPLTREALREYQSNNGLYVTEAIDQPTLESLGLT
jgi:hypothetical protein